MYSGRQSLTILLDHFYHDRAIEKTGEVLKMIQQKGFVWCLMHPSDIDRRIESAGVAIVDAYQHFNVRVVLP